jgi:hypothetical protein
MSSHPASIDLHSVLRTLADRIGCKAKPINGNATLIQQTIFSNITDQYVTAATLKLHQINCQRSCMTDYNHSKHNAIPKHSPRLLHKKQLRSNKQFVTAEAHKTEQPSNNLPAVSNPNYFPMIPVHDHITFSNITMCTMWCTRKTRSSQKTKKAISTPDRNSHNVQHIVADLHL